MNETGMVEQELGVRGTAIRELEEGPDCTRLWEVP